MNLNCKKFKNAVNSQNFTNTNILTQNAFKANFQICESYYLQKFWFTPEMFNLEFANISDFTVRSNIKSELKKKKKKKRSFA